MKIGNMEYIIPPAEFEPIIVIKQANFTKIWIYRGSEIKEYLYHIWDTREHNPFLVGNL